METVAIFIILLLCVGRSAFLEECNSAPAEEKRNICEITSRESGRKDDDKTNTTCPVGYSIVDCILVQVAKLLT